ncbi:D-alanine--D-alanine ligase [Raoultibacter phocaeensis]|uniref:D-alanine--D-alanine ligase n=1 Tax=Raoultibacter phocaeensis TaxID=2479841 RepID=UPI0011195060|nr:D-alanine--D-alanine ligase [Raoultibacter phocaeensis]
MTKTFTPHTCKVALIAGGKSGEREISLASGEGAKEALEQAGFPVTSIDPAKREDLVALIEGDFDVAFLCLHGKYGEDGTMQGMLEIIGLPYIGSDVWSSALAMDKSKSKVFYEQAGLRTPRSVTLYAADRVENEMPHKAITAAVGERAVVKPATEGSALGVFIVTGEAEIAAAIEKAFEIDSEVLVETYIEGDEFTVAVIGNDEPEALPVIKIVPTNEFYDFESKYAPGGSQHLCPAPLSDEQTAEVQRMAVDAHKALGCRGVSRSDFILDSEGAFWLLETNTIPGMTGTSLLPDAGRAAGMSFPELCTKLIKLALER